jgi:hypothetical protein
MQQNSTQVNRFQGTEPFGSIGMGIQNQNFPASFMRITVNLEDAAMEEEKLFNIIEVSIVN